MGIWGNRSNGGTQPRECTSRDGVAKVEAACYVLARMVNKFQVWGCNVTLGGLKPCILTAGFTHLMSPMGDSPHGGGVLHEWRNQDLLRKGERDVTRVTRSSSSRNTEVGGKRGIHFCLLVRVGQFGCPSVPLLSERAPRSSGWASMAKERLKASVFLPLKCIGVNA